MVNNVWSGKPATRWFLWDKGNDATVPVLVTLPTFAPGVNDDLISYR